MDGSTNTAPLKAVRRFVEGFNKNDTALARTACADQMTIIDDFAPYEWSGSGALEAWSRDMHEMASKYGMSEWSVTLEEPVAEIVSDDRAYLVVSIDVHWLEEGVPAERRGFMTLAVRESSEAWGISTLAWTWK